MEQNPEMSQSHEMHSRQRFLKTYFQIAISNVLNEYYSATTQYKDKYKEGCIDALLSYINAILSVTQLNVSIGTPLTTTKQQFYYVPYKNGTSSQMSQPTHRYSQQSVLFFSRGT